MAAQGDGGAVGPGAAHHVSNVRFVDIPLGEVGVERLRAFELRRSGRARGGERANRRRRPRGVEVTPPRGRAMRTMALNSVTLLVSQASSELKALALWNVTTIVVTALVSHASGLLKKDAP